MNYKAITFGLAAAVFAARADDCTPEYCQQIFSCDESNVQYLLDVASYEGLTADRIARLNGAEKLSVKMGIENKISALEANLLSSNQVTLTKTGRIALRILALAALAATIYYACRADNKYATYSSASDREAVFREEIEVYKLPGRDNLSFLLPYLARKEEQIAATYWPIFLKALAMSIGSFAAMTGSLFGLDYFNKLLEPQAMAEQELSNLRASLALFNA